VGSPRIVTAASGTAIKILEYHSFGNVTFDSNPGFDLPVGFAGGIDDRKSGLVRFGFRDYDALAGRWTAKDPIGFAGGINLFNYVQNNPINVIDPWGTYDVSVSNSTFCSGGSPNVNTYEYPSGDFSASVPRWMEEEWSLERERRFLSTMESLLSGAAGSIEFMEHWSFHLSPLPEWTIFISAADATIGDSMRHRIDDITHDQAYRAWQNTTIDR
ncbi:MAG: RHS repeat-associated core domain-containing protein, partial [Desulfocapsaceae bacterium]|nr:RHS repeat-associated core domain-containing protein [Desulfocapsaceae bacterium]